MRLELFDPGSTEPPIVLAEYKAAEAEIGALAGRAVALRIREGQAPIVAASRGFGQHPGDISGDGDGDGVPDAADTCLEVADRGQADSDNDGFGDACDADFDQDRVVSAADVALVEGCVGSDGCSCGSGSGRAGGHLLWLLQRSLSGGARALRPERRRHERARLGEGAGGLLERWLSSFE
jgi:hypothetical protein